MEALEEMLEMEEMQVKDASFANLNLDVSI